MFDLRAACISLAMFSVAGCSVKTEQQDDDIFAPLDERTVKESEWRYRGYELIREGDVRGAIKIYDAALKDSNDPAAVLLARGDALHRLDLYAAAREDYRAVLRINPHDADAWIGMGVCHMEAEEYYDAIHAATQAIECGNKDSMPYRIRGSAHYYMGNFEDALQDYDEVARREPNETEVHVYRGGVFDASGDHVEAIKAFDLRLAGDPTDAEAWARRGRAYMTLGYTSRGLADLEEAIKHDADVPHYHAYLGSLYTTLHDQPAAMEHFAKATELDRKTRNLALPPAANPTLTDEDLSHGRAEIEKLIRDRPALAEHVREGNPLWTWIVRRFAGEGGTGRIFWDSQPPVNYDGESVLSQETTPAAIRVGLRESAGPALGAPLSFQRTISAVVFEFFNQVAHEDFKSHYDKLLAGEFDPPTFARKYVETEELTVSRTRRFCCDVFLPWAQSVRLNEFDADTWGLTHWAPAHEARYDEYFRSDSRFDDYQASAYDGYAYGIYEREGEAAAQKYVDETLSEEYLKPKFKAALLFVKSGYLYSARRENAASAALYEAYRNDPSIVDSLIERGQGYLAESSPEGAVADFANAIRLAPANPSAYGHRGNALFQQQYWDRALEDFNRAVELNGSDAAAYYARASVWHALANEPRELADLEKCIDLDPKNHAALIRRAQILVLSANEKTRNGKLAIESATKACEATNWQEVSAIVMLAAGHAEAGNLDEAVKWQKKAAEMTPEANRAPVEAAIAIYESGKTLRDLPPVSSEKLP